MLVSDVTPEPPLLHRFIWREFGYEDMRTMLDRLRDVPAGFDASGEREYVRALYLSPTAPVRAEELIEYDANSDHTLNALKQPNESLTARTRQPVFRELMFKEEN